MSTGSSGQHGGLCLMGSQGRIPREDPDRMGACVRGDSKGGSRDVQGILRTAWGPVSERIPREDPGMSKGSSRQLGKPASEGTSREDPRMSSDTAWAAV